MKFWLIGVLLVSFLFLALLKGREVSSLGSVYAAEKSFKLATFENARLKVAKEDMDVFELWESILTGRAAPLSRIMKEKYKTLGLNHIFTPSGFHLTAILFPVLKLISSYRIQLLFLIILGIGLSFLPGFAALKRMVLIKGHQKVIGLKAGFLFALVLDMMFGSFQEHSLSFTYSFLFIGIIYSGMKGLSLIVWFYLAQLILAHFQGNDISPLLLLFSPILNFLFGALMPLLFLLSYPLFDWQLQTGLWLLNGIQTLVDVFAEICARTPTWEVHLGLLGFMYLIFSRKWKWVPAALIAISSSLNLDNGKSPVLMSNFVPRGKHVKTIYKENYASVIFSDGRCRMKLVRGFWYESCSPIKRSSRSKKIKKLSYPS